MEWGILLPYVAAASTGGGGGMTADAVGGGFDGAPIAPAAPTTPNAPIFKGSVDKIECDGGGSFVGDATATCDGFMILLTTCCATPKWAAAFIAAGDN